MAYSFEPSITNNVFTPDQLIGGSAQIITDTVTLASGLTLVRGTLIGQQTAGLYAAAVTALNSTGGANTGNATMGTVTPGVEAKIGTYRANMTTATAFTVTDPSGETVGTGVLGTAFASPQIGFTATAGGIAMVANDGFNIAVEETAGSGNGYYVAATGVATDGSSNPHNWVVLAEDANTSSAGTNAATTVPVYLAGEFDSAQMTLGTGLTAAGVKAALRQAGSAIVIKTGALSNAIV
jgi:hypothetical protein